MLLGVAASRRRSSGAVAYGPRLTPGIAGAVSSPSLPGTVVRLSAGVHTNLNVAANTLVLPQIGAEGAVTVQGTTSFGSGGTLYGVTLQPNGAQWCARPQATNVGIYQCDFTGNPTVEHIRPERAGLQVVGNVFAGSPTNHHIKVDGRDAKSGGGIISDNLFRGSPSEDYVQTEGQTATTIEHNAFDGVNGGAGEDCIDIKNGAAVTVRGHDFVASAMGAEALLFQNGTGASTALQNRFTGCFCSYGAHPELGTTVTGSMTDSVFAAGSTLRLRRSNALEITGLAMTSATVRLGTSTTNDFPTAAWFHHNQFHNLTIVVSNSNSSTVTSDNTYTGTTTGSFPSGNN